MTKTYSCEVVKQDNDYCLKIYLGTPNEEEAVEKAARLLVVYNGAIKQHD